MDDRQPSSHEMRARLGWGGGLAVGMGVGVALGVSFDDMGLGIALGLALGVALMGAFTVAGSRRRRPDAGEAGRDGGAHPDDDAPSAGGPREG